MSFIDTLFSNWEIVLFIGGGLFNVGYTISTINNTKIKHEEDVRELKENMEKLSKRVDITQSDFSEIRGDIKSINAKLDLLINNKIK